ncbi:MAG TPA: HNH endonuclease [Bdellovibrio sp.]|uniref:homing endonuclease associated repeat-containing protein n=1 Tax=Bdellovibrio sp. TaxID=28201 RepID=UPI002EFC8896
MSKFKVQIRRRNIPDEEILADLRRVATELKKDTCTKVEYDERGNFGATTILRRFKQWNQALQLAGLDFPNRQNVPDEELFENLADAWTKLGKQPVGREIDKTEGLSKFSLGTYEKRFGSWNKTLLAFEEFIQSGKTSGETSEIAKEIRPGKRRTQRQINWRLRAQVLIRNSCICQMCGASPAKDPSVVLHVDHIKPWSKGGETVLENLQTLCSVCNIGKSDAVDES